MENFWELNGLYVLEWAVGLRGLGLGGPVPAPKLTDWGMKCMRI